MTSYDSTRFLMTQQFAVPSVYIHHEHRDDPHERDHHQLELSHTANASHAALDPRRLPRTAASSDHDDTTVSFVSLVPHTTSALSDRHFLRQSQTGIVSHIRIKQ